MKLGVKPNNYTERNIIAFFCVITMLLVGVQPAFAGGISDIVNTLIVAAIKFACKLTAGILANIIQLFLKGMGVDITEYRSMGLLSGFDTFTGVIRAIGIGIASVAIIWQFFTILFGPMLGLKQDKSVGLIITRALIFIPLTYGVQSIAESAFSAMQSVYSAILSGYTNAVVGATGEGIYAGLVTAMTNSELLKEYVVDTGAGATEYFSLIGIVISALVLILVLWNFLKLVFEAIQRFAIMIVYIYLSPLATACGVVGDGSIPRKALTLFFSSGVLWILNIWCVGVAQSLISLYPAALVNGTTGVMAWTFLNYGFIKIAQQLDDIFNTVGATNVRLNGDLLGDLIGIGQSAQKFGSFTDFVKNKISPGKDNKTGIGSGSGNDTTKTTASTTPLSKATGQEIDNALKATDESKRNAALNAIKKNENIKGGLEDVMNNPQVKDYMAHKMDLGDNQSLVSRKGYVGSEQAIVATKKADGSVSFNKVGNLGEATTGGGNTYNPECDRLSANKTVGAFNSDIASQNNAVFKYTGTDGVTRAAQVDNLGSGKFAVVTANGNDMTITAPQNATAGEVASMLNGSASEATRQKFEGCSYAADAKTVSSAQGEFNIDSAKGGEVMGGTFYENSPNTTATISGKEGYGSTTLYRTNSGAVEGQTTDTWVAECDGSSASFNVPKGMGAAQVVSEYIRQAGEDINNVEGVPIIDGNSEIAFTSDHRSVGPDLMQPDIADTYSGSRMNGTTWSDALNLKYSEDKAGNARMDLSYESGNNNTPFSIIETNRSYGGDGLGDKYYTIVSDAIEGGSATFKFSEKADINQVTAALMSGDAEAFDLGTAQGNWENIVRDIGFVSHDNYMKGNSNFKSVVDKEDVANNSFAEILDCLNNNFNTKNNPAGNKK